MLIGQAFEMGGHLPYQPLMEAMRTRLQAENAPEDLWLAELSRLLPELRVRSPDLPPPTQDELSARGQMFEAVARLLPWHNVRRWSCCWMICIGWRAPPWTWCAIYIQRCVQRLSFPLALLFMRKEISTMTKPAVCILFSHRK